MDKISTYILTKNSQKYLFDILKRVEPISDEILIIDSGSTDKTREISTKFEKVRFLFNEFENFKEQRLFAETEAKFDYIFFIDCDEIPNEELIETIKKKKDSGFEFDAYIIRRNWFVLGKSVHSIYPLSSPDFPIRLYNKKHASFKNAKLVHEAPVDFRSKEIISGTIKHITFETEKELEEKLQFYTDIAAKEHLRKNKTVNRFKIITNPVAAFLKFYIIKKGFLDGLTGLKLAKYAYDYNKLKHEKALKLKNQK